MAKRSGYLARLQTERQIMDARVRDHQRTFTLDIVTIALGRCGMNSDDLKHFRDVYMETEQDYRDEILNDFYGNHDKNIEYAKDRIDRILQEYVSEDMFQPWNERYGGGYR